MYIFSIDIFGITIAPTYYGLMYVLGFMLGYTYLTYKKVYSSQQLEKLFMYVFIGVIVGGRLGYVLFYNPSYILDFSQNFPFWKVLAVHQGGMSFHGGFIGVIVSLCIYSKKESISFLKLCDNIAPLAAIGIFFGRIGNYINKELLGFPYDGFLAVQTESGTYFPSPLVEALFEGLILCALLFILQKKQQFDGQIAAVFCIGYGVFRSIIELFIRTPDTHIGYYFGFLTQGSILSFCMIILGVFLYYSLKDKKYVSK